MGLGPLLRGLAHTVPRKGFPGPTKGAYHRQQLERAQEQSVGGFGSWEWGAGVRGSKPG